MKYHLILLFLVFTHTGHAQPFAIIADNETPPINTQGDAADDPAIWINNKNFYESIIFGTDKRTGIHAYTIKGDQLTYKSFGHINNIDLREIGDYLILAGTKRDSKEILFWKFLKSDIFKKLSNNEFPDPISSVKSEQDIYGLCMGYVDKELLIFVTEDMGPNVQIWSIQRDELSLKHTFSNNGESEGCVVDDFNKKIFISEEDKAGVLRSFDLSSAAFLQSFVIDSRDGNIWGDPEGVSIYKTSKDEGYIILSSQGDSKFNLYNRKYPHNYLGSFRVVGSTTIDGVSETDGLDAASISIPGLYPKGFLVVQDGYNTDKTRVLNQNFKIISFDKILTLIN
jgi:3-phytase